MEARKIDDYYTDRDRFPLVEEMAKNEMCCPFADQYFSSFRIQQTARCSIHQWFRTLIEIYELHPILGT